MVETLENESGFMIRRIAITGPESTGKSRLTAELAAHFETIMVPEYAREYLNSLNRPYTQTDILQIAQNQFDQENIALQKANKYLFVDTDFLVTKIWSEFCYKTCPGWIEEKFHTHLYDLYLLCDVDLPWEPDPLREHPLDGGFFFNWFHNELTNNKMPFVVIRGSGDHRTNNAINAITEYFTDQ